MYLTEDPMCPNCTTQAKTPDHYFLKCEKYANERLQLINKIFILEEVAEINTNLLTSGNAMLSLETNIQKHDAVANYIKLSKRFVFI